MGKADLGLLNKFTHVRVFRRRLWLPGLAHAGPWNATTQVELRGAPPPAAWWRAGAENVLRPSITSLTWINEADTTSARADANHSHMTESSAAAPAAVCDVPCRAQPKRERGQTQRTVQKFRKFEAAFGFAAYYPRGPRVTRDATVLEKGGALASDVRRQTPSTCQVSDVSPPHAHHDLRLVRRTRVET